MAELSPAVELILRAGELCRAGPAGDVGPLRQQLEAVDCGALAPAWQAVWRAAEAVAEAAPADRTAPLEALSARLAELDEATDAAAPDHDARAAKARAWNQRKDLQ